MKNKEIALIFNTMGQMMEVLGENPFRVNSYYKAARVIDDLSEDIEPLCKAGHAKDVPGIGESTAAKIAEYCSTGKIARYEELKAKMPEHLPELLRLSGMGPKTVAKLWKEANITSLADLKLAVDTDRERLTGIAGMGEKKVQQIAESLKFVQAASRHRLGEVRWLVDELLDQIRHIRGVGRVEAAGSFRRGAETVGDIDLLCEASDADAPAIIEQFTHLPRVSRVLAEGGTKGSVMLDQHVQADLRAVPPQSFGAALAYFTGSKAHNVHLRERAVKLGMRLNEYGLYKLKSSPTGKQISKTSLARKRQAEQAQGAEVETPASELGEQIAGADEPSIYAALGLPYVPPELREDRGELDAAERGQLPNLVQPADIHGDFHMHTTLSDGRNTIEEMINACRALGYTAIAITEHSRSQHIAGGLKPEALVPMTKAIHKVAQKYDDILVLAGCEVDILKDGSLDYEDALLAELDFVLASPHAALTQTPAEATARIIKAIEHPLVHAIAHVTGRIINQRPGMEVDIDAIAQAAARHGVALEINADPARLDLRDTHARTALARGAFLMINTDAHSTEGLRDSMPYGLLTARRAWATPDQIVNCWPVDRLRQWLAQKRKSMATK